MQQAPSDDVDTCEVINPANKDALCEYSVRLMERRHDNVPAAGTGHSLGWGVSDLKDEHNGISNIEDH